jgi:threonine synthase
MRYVSTRGDAPELGFADVLLAGLAVDGGLYVPSEWPSLGTVSGSYADVAAAVMAPFVGADVAPATLAAMCQSAYATFAHDAVCPLVQIGDNDWLLELFHGPTLAFKDVALQLVGRLFDHVLASRGQRATIVVATSGDTGSAAIAGVLDCEHIDIVVLFPEGRVSEVQRRQMTTVDAPNVHTVAVAGTFDDCQDLVKAMFNDPAFRERQHLSAMNSINWARVMAQVVYYVTSATAVGGGVGGREVAFSVPSGNFGNVLAGWVARQMGLPVAQLVVASNRNDILTRFIDSGLMEQRGVHPTISPSMDIQVSSNVERLLFEAFDRDGAQTAREMQSFRTTGTMTLGGSAREHLAVFSGAAFDDAMTTAEITHQYRTNELLVDPHTAVGIAASRARRGDPAVPMISLATAHPAKFPDAVEAATGVRPALPAHLADLLDRTEHHVSRAADLGVLQRFVTEVTAS